MPFGGTVKYLAADQSGTDRALPDTLRIEAQRAKKTVPGPDFRKVETPATEKIRPVCERLGQPDLRRRYPRTSRRKARGMLRSQAYEHGKRVGRRVELHRPVGTGNASTFILPFLALRPQQPIFQRRLCTSGGSSINAPRHRDCRARLRHSALKQLTHVPG